MIRRNNSRGRKRIGLARKLVPETRKCEYCETQYASIRPHCSDLVCYAKHRLMIEQLKTKRKADIRNHPDACSKCTFSLDEHSKRNGLRLCTACRYLLSDSKQRGKERRQGDSTLQKAADIAYERVARAKVEKVDAISATVDIKTGKVKNLKITKVETKDS